MGSIFRITKAEFVKTFKRPTIYIMAFILLIAAIITTFIYEPAARTEDRINYASATDSINVYNIFYESGSNSKSAFDATLADTNTKVNYYKNMQLRENGINEAFDEVNNIYNQLRNNNATVNDYRGALESFKAAINSKYGMTDEFIDTSYSTVYYQELSNNIDTYISQCTSKEAVITGYTSADSNGLTLYDKLNNVRLGAINVITNTLNFYISNAAEAHQVIWEMDFNGDFGMDAMSMNIQNNQLNKIKNNIENYYSYINQLFSDKYNAIYMQDEDYKDLESIRSYLVQNLIPNTTSSSNQNVRINNMHIIANHNFVTRLKNTTSNLTIIKPDANTINLIDTAYSKIQSDLDVIIQNIDDNATTSDMSIIKGYVTDYSIMCNAYSQYVNDTILLNTTNEMSLQTIRTLKGDDFKSYNEYQVKERQVLNLYKINNNVSGQYNLNTFSFNNNSGYETNGYDYMFYTLSIMAVLIIIFSIMMTAISVGSEQDSGTIKLLLVRPFKRTQILLSKLLSVFFFIFTFTLFAFVICLIAALIMYGLPATSVLVVFNASQVFTIHPLLLLAIYCTCIIFQVCFYSAFAFVISVIFKNFATALVSSLIVYLGGITCNILLANNIAFKWIPFTNSYLFRYFGGAFAKSSSQLSNVFVSPIYSSMGFIWSLVMCLGVIVLLDIISIITFKKRDF